MIEAQEIKNQDVDTEETIIETSPKGSKLSKRAKYTVEMLLTPIKGSQACGASLRHELIYDKIREARREDDGTLSRGVWQFELKQADWGDVEKLAGDALMKQSKDLQIAGWVGESWMMMGGLAGLSQSLDLIGGLCEKFWPCLYPEIDDGDMEYRSQFFDWYDQNLSQRLVGLPIAEEEFVDYPFTLADWLSAIHFETAVKRSPDASKMIQRAESKGQATIKRLQALLRQVPHETIQEKLDVLKIISQKFQGFMGVLNTLMPDSTVAFNQFKPALDDMIRVYKTEIDNRPAMVAATIPSIDKSQMEEDVWNSLGDNSEEGSSSKTKSESSKYTQGSSLSELTSGELTRERAYAHLSEIADYFQRVDPHNPAAPILQRLVSWQNKPLMDIFAEMGSTPEELMAFMKFIGIAAK